MGTINSYLLQYLLTTSNIFSNFHFYRNPYLLSHIPSQNMQDSFQETPATQSWVDHTPKLPEDVSLRKMNSKTPITNSQALSKYHID